MRKYIVLGLALGVFSLLGGCNSDNKEAQTSAPLSTTPGAISPVGNIQAQVVGPPVINGRPVITFKLLDEKGAPLNPATPGLNLSFLIARLKADGSYENYIDNGSGLPGADSTGTFAAVGGGVYTYTFVRDITNAAQTLKNIAYNATDPNFSTSQTHTVGIEIFRTVSSIGGPSFQQVQNVYLNFRPDGVAALTQTREIVATSYCNECHGRIGQTGSPHGGARREVALCILCHNPGLVVGQAATGLVSLDFKVLIHKIHMGKKLPGNIAALALNPAAPAAPTHFGFSNGARSFASVGHPFISADPQITERPIECTKCHRLGTDSSGRSFGRDVDRWKTAVTRENCRTCHDTAVFSGETNVNVADATFNAATGIYTPKLTNITDATRISQHATLSGIPTLTDDVFCTGCHPATSEDYTPAVPGTKSVPGAHTIFEKSALFVDPVTGRDDLNFQIISVVPATAVAGGKPTVTFSVTDKAGNPVSPIATRHVPGTSGTAFNDVSFNLKLGYFRQADYVNDGMGNYGQPLTQGTNGVAAGTTPTCTADFSSCTITFATAIPATATGTGVIGLEGTKYYTLPTTPKNPIATSRNVRTSGDGTQYYFDLATGTHITDPARQRRISVDIDKCNSCHGGSLSLHGGNRKNSVQECVICHNPNATDRNQRPVPPAVGVDGLAEQPIHFKVMIHRIHTGVNLLDSLLPLTSGGFGYIIYGNGGSINDFGDVRFPRDRRDCLACHVDTVPTSFGVPLPANVLGTTTSTGTDMNNAGGDDNVRTTPTLAACLSCHDNLVLWNAVPQFGILVHAPGSATDASGAELCTNCHRTGLLRSAELAHWPIR